MIKKIICFSMFFFIITTKIINAHPNCFSKTIDDKNIKNFLYIIGIKDRTVDSINEKFQLFTQQKSSEDLQDAAEEQSTLRVQNSSKETQLVYTRFGAACIHDYFKDQEFKEFMNISSLTEKEKNFLMSAKNNKNDLSNKCSSFLGRFSLELMFSFLLHQAVFFTLL
jgi:hypothetical protein